MADGLDTMIQPGGSSLSNGEQKVICCIRGLIRKLIYNCSKYFPNLYMIHVINVHRINDNNWILDESKWVILDEPTSALSTKMEELVLSAFWKRFKDSTLLMITHNLENVIGFCEKVLVLDRGKIREFDTPSNLLKNEHSMFYSMAKDTGII